MCKDTCEEKTDLEKILELDLSDSPPFLENPLSEESREWMAKLQLRDIDELTEADFRP